MYNLIKFELYKLKRNNTFRNCLIIIFCLIFFTLRLFINHPGKWMIFNYSYEGRYYGFWINNFKDKLNPTAIEFLYSSFGFSIIVVILTIFLVGSFIIDEYFNGTIKNIISYGHKRTQIYLSKLIIISLSTFILIFTLLLGTPVVATMCGLVKFFSSNSLISSIKFVFMVWLIFTSIISIYTCLAVLLKNKSILVGAGIVYIFLNAGGFFSNLINYKKYTPTFMLTDIGIIYPTTLNTCHIILTCTILIICSTLIGIYIFKKQDIK